MELNSESDVNALTELKKIDKINQLEYKIKRLNYVPLFCTVILMSWAVWTIWSSNEWSMGYHIIIIGFAFFSVAGSINLRSDLQHQLAEIKFNR